MNTHYIWANEIVSELDKEVVAGFFEVGYDEWVKYLKVQSTPKAAIFHSKILEWKENRTRFNNLLGVTDMTFILGVGSITPMY
jgi:hypothetical protein